MPRSGIRHRLLSSFLVLASVPLLLAGLALGWLSFQRDIDEAKLRQQETARRIAVEAETFMAHALANLEHAIRYSSFISADDQARRRILERVLSERNLYREISYVDAKGNEPIHLSNVRVIDEQDFNDHPAAFQSAIDVALGSGQTAGSLVYYDDESNEPLMQVAVPVRVMADDPFTGLLVAEVRLKAIWNLIAGLRLEAGEDAYILGADGELLAHRNPSLVLAGTRAAIQPGGDSQTGLQGRRVFLATQDFTFGQRAFRVVAEREVRNALQVAVEQLIVVGLVILLALAGALVLGRRLARSLSEPIVAVAETAKAIRDGDMEREAPVTSDDEIGEMARTFNAMTFQVRQSLRLLEEEVDERRAAQEELERHRNRLEELVAERTAELRRQQVFAAAVLENISDGIVACDEHGMLSLFNRATREMHGIDQEDLPPEQWSSHYRLFLADGATPMRKEDIPLFRAFSGEMLKDEEFVLEHVNGRKLSLRCSGQPMHDAEGRLVGAVVSMHDVTLQKAAEEALVRAKEAAEEASKAKSSFLANMSHELRTPMNAILGMLYLALRNDPPPALRSYLSKAQGAAQALLGIINDILDFSKIEAGKLEIERIEFGLDNVVERVSDAVCPIAVEKGVEFLIRYDVAIPATLVGDPLRLGQVLLNLCSNAVKFTERGEVELAFRGEDVAETSLVVRICVRDTGIGMSSELQGRLFEKFVQADQTTTRRFGGTGLGLAISRSLVEMMGGRIWVEQTVPGEGTTICFSLPLGISPCARTDRRQQLTNAIGRQLEGIRVLVVDDNEVAREIIVDMLRNFRLEVDAESSAAAALATLEAAGEQRPYDIVLMDWRMPGMSGDEAIRKLRKSAVLARQPKVIMVTAYGREDVVSKAESAGVEGFLVKPVSPSSLLDAIMTALGRGHLLSVVNGRSAEKRQGRGVKYDFSGIRLLLVEDNDINRDFARELLRDEGIEVVEAKDGLEAIEKLQQQEFDAVLMDIQMPNMDGLDATRVIRAFGNEPGSEWLGRLPIIAMTALAMTLDEERSRAAGMNDHVSKPFDPERLLSVLAHWVARPQRPASEVGDAEAEGEIPADLLALTSLDVRKGIHRIGDKPDAYRRQLERFREHFTDAAVELRRLIDEQGIQQAENYCHAFKGVAGNIGADALYETIMAIDATLKQGNPPPADVLQEMASRLQAVIADIGQLDAPSGAAPKDAGRETAALQPRILVSQLEQLAHSLEYDLGAVERLIAQLRAETAGSQWEQAISDIARRVDVFELGGAKVLLDELLARIKHE